MPSFVTLMFDRVKKNDQGLAEVLSRTGGSLIDSIVLFGARFKLDTSEMETKLDSLLLKIEGDRLLSKDNPAQRATNIEDSLKKINELVNGFVSKIQEKAKSAGKDEAAQLAVGAITEAFNKLKEQSKLPRQSSRLPGPKL